MKKSRTASRSSSAIAIPARCGPAERPSARAAGCAARPPRAASASSPRSSALRRAFAEEPFGPEDEDQDQDREHDRLGPVGAGRVPVEAFVERLDAADQDRAEHGAGQVADAAEHRGGERDQPELEALVEAHGRHVERVEETCGAGERAGDQERERDRAVDVDTHPSMLNFSNTLTGIKCQLLN